MQATGKSVVLRKAWVLSRCVVAWRAGVLFNRLLAKSESHLFGLAPGTLKMATFTGCAEADYCLMSHERPPKHPTFRNSYTRTAIMKLSGMIEVIQKTMTFDTQVCLILLPTSNP